MEQNAAQGHDSELCFGGFTLDVGRRGLYRDGERLRLTAKPLEVLILLARNPGRTIEKREILDAVWKDTFVTEDVLVQAVREIRRVLGDDKEDPQFVQTVPRQGYRFVARVQPPEPPAPRGADAATSPRARSPALRWLIPAAVVAGGGLLLLAAGQLRHGSRRESPAARSGRSNAPLRHLSFGVPTAVKPAYSPDGKTLLFVSETEPGVQDLYVMPAAGGNAWRITDRFDVRGDLPVFTPDGSRIVFGRYRTGEGGGREPDLWIVPSFGGTPRILIREASGAGFSPDGERIAYTNHSGGRAALWLGPTADPSAAVEVAERGFVPRFSPDGRWLAYTTSDPEGAPGELWIRREGEGPVPLTNGAGQVYGLAWTADSRALVFSSDGGGAFHLKRVSISGGDPKPLTVGLGDYFSPTASPEGGTLAFAYVRPTRDLHLAPRITRTETEQLTRGEYHYSPRLSPSGRRVASVVHQPDATEHVFVIDLATRRRNSVGETPARSPCWVDDQRVAFLADAAAATEVRLADVFDGTSRVLTRFAGRAEWVAVNADLSRVAIVGASERGRRILVRDLPSGRDTIAAQGGEYEGLRWNPDGTRLAWSGPPVSAGPASNGVWIHAPGGSPPRRVLDDGYAPVWSADGASIFFVRYGRDDAGLWELRLGDHSLVERRPWKRVKYFDLAADSLLFVEDGTSPSSIYSLPLDR